MIAVDMRRDRKPRILWDGCKLGVNFGNEGSNEMIKGVWNDSIRNSV